MERTKPLWEYRIRRDLEQGKTVLVVGHANSLRGLAKLIDNIGDDAVANVSFPKGSPFVYDFDPKGRPMQPKMGSILQPHTSGFFLEKANLFEQALREQKKWDERVPGSYETLIPSVTKRMTTLEKSLLKLREEQALIRKVESGDSTIQQESLTPSDTALEFMDDERFEFEVDSHIDDPTFLTGHTTVNINQVDVKKDPVVVLIRHGRTPHNKLALFTGWEDPPLAKEGTTILHRRQLSENSPEIVAHWTDALTRQFRC
jgi:2,3-bisphosphoglycerate-dependent phosphoglycerate mutase